MHKPEFLRASYKQIEVSGSKGFCKAPGSAFPWITGLTKAYEKALSGVMVVTGIRLEGKIGKKELSFKMTQGW